MATTRNTSDRPSILSADFARLGEEVRAIDQAGCDWVHVDVMDGHFVPNITIGPGVVKAIRPHTQKPLDVHLMIAPADPFIAAFAGAGADGITRTTRRSGLISTVRFNSSAPLQKGRRFAHTPDAESALAYVIDRLDLILVMTVNPGFGGQAFIPAMVEKIARVRSMIGPRPIQLEVDGGVTPDTAALCAKAGANVFVAGSAVFKKTAPVRGEYRRHSRGPPRCANRPPPCRRPQTRQPRPPAHCRAVPMMRSISNDRSLLAFCTARISLLRWSQTRR